MFVQTERLVLRRFTSADVDNLVALDADPEVMRFLTKGRPTPRSVVKNEVLPRFLSEYERFNGLGHWAAMEKSSAEFLGWFGLRPSELGNADEFELGYRLRKSAWGRGYATEGSRALVVKAFREFSAQRVTATTMAVNTASRRVMEKAGLRYVRTFHLVFDDPIEGTELGEVEYAITRSAYERSTR